MIKQEVINGIDQYCRALHFISQILDDDKYLIFNDIDTKEKFIKYLRTRHLSREFTGMTMKNKNYAAAIDTAYDLVVKYYKEDR